MKVWVAVAAVLVICLVVFGVVGILSYVGGESTKTTNAGTVTPLPPPPRLQVSTSRYLQGPAGNGVFLYVMKDTETNVEYLVSVTYNGTAVCPMGIRENTNAEKD
jgi:hypothetical protein